ncbi:hypothetical protein EAG_15084, partial [Camponotus floridanus]
YKKGRHPIKFLHDKAWPHVAKLTKGILLEHDWVVLPSIFIAHSVLYYLFPSMQQALSDRKFRNVKERNKKMIRRIYRKTE